MNPTLETPLYLDWTFWAVVIATIAIILSQLPPLHFWFRKAKLDIELYSRIHLTHKVGNPNAQLHLIITNSGGRTVRVKGVTMSIRSEGKEVAIMPAQNYLNNPSDESSVLFTSFVLKPNDEWGHLVNFLKYFNKVDEKKYRIAESKMREKIVELKKLPENKDNIVEVDESLVDPFIEMFNDKFIWNPGEYEFKISVNAIKANASIEKKYRFTIFESDSNDLLKSKEDFKSGDGINWSSGNHPGIIVEIFEA